MKPSEGYVLHAEGYLQHAQECERQAAAAKSNSARQMLLETAAQWRKLAASVAGTPSDRDESA